jgi:hypothetical protein
MCRPPHYARKADELMAYVAGRVAPFKKIRRLEFIDTVADTQSGKILRRILKEVAVTQSPPPSPPPPPPSQPPPLSLLLQSLEPSEPPPLNIQLESPALVSEPLL